MASDRLSALDWLCFALLIVGALNWGIIGLVEINVVELILDSVFQPAAAEMIERAIYVLVGLAGLYVLYPLYKMSRQRQELEREREQTRERRDRETTASPREGEGSGE